MLVSFSQTSTEKTISSGGDTETSTIHSILPHLLSHAPLDTMPVHLVMLCHCSSNEKWPCSIFYPSIGITPFKASPQSCSSSVPQSEVSASPSSASPRYPFNLYFIHTSYWLAYISVLTPFLIHP